MTFMNQNNQNCIGNSIRLTMHVLKYLNQIKLKLNKII